MHTKLTYKVDITEKSNAVCKCDCQYDLGHPLIENTIYYKMEMVRFRGVFHLPSVNDFSARILIVIFAWKTPMRKYVTTVKLKKN